MLKNPKGSQSVLKRPEALPMCPTASRFGCLKARPPAPEIHVLNGVDIGLTSVTCNHSGSISRSLRPHNKAASSQSRNSFRLLYFNLCEGLLFPTSFCGVLVFGCLLPAASVSRAPATHTHTRQEWIII